MLESLEHCSRQRCGFVGQSSLVLLHPRFRRLRCQPVSLWTKRCYILADCVQSNRVLSRSTVEIALLGFVTALFSLRAIAHP